MPLKLDDKLVVGISSRALFDLEEENEIYENSGLKAYSDYQLKHEDDILKPGTAFPLIKALHKLNTEDQRLTEIIVMSKNSADTSLRVFNSIKHYNLDISRAALVGRPRAYSNCLGYSQKCASPRAGDPNPACLERTN